MKSESVVEVDLLVGTLIDGRWQVQSKLRSGGMGAVYVAHHKDTGRPVALKVIQDDTPEMYERFRKETRALAAVSHPNVVTFLDSGVGADGNLFLVMELLHGKDLRAEMTRPLPWQRALRIAADVCRGLIAVHKLGLVHRDLKPENIFLQESEGHEGFVKLLDFGIARRVANPSSTKTGLIGTAGYISPELIDGDEPTAASDLYGLGVVLYEMIAGALPFDGDTPRKRLEKQLKHELVPLASKANVPPAVESLVHRFLARDPAGRPPSAAEALKLLATPPVERRGPRSLESAPVSDDLPPAAPTEEITKTPPLSDEEAATHLDLGLAYREMGLYEEAKAEFRLLLKLPTHAGKALYMLGEVYEVEGDGKNARSFYEQSLRVAEPGTPLQRDAAAALQRLQQKFS